MSLFQPPPTYVLPILVDEKTGKAQFHPIWLKWFVDFARVLSQLGVGSGGQAEHNFLAGIQGGQTGQYYHLTASQYAGLSQYQAFPVGSIFATVSPANPNTLLGYGTWTPFAQGRALFGVDPVDPDFDTVEETGGSKTATFTP